MALNYGVLKGTVAGHLRDADDDHYQILVHAGKTVWRIASKRQVCCPEGTIYGAVLFRHIAPAEFLAGLKGWRRDSRSYQQGLAELAIDYIRGGLVKPKQMKELPPDVPGENNDLKDKLEEAVLKAMAVAGSVIYAFGDRWGPEENKADKYFKFKPGNGIHDIHMNQGNSGKYMKDNGVYQDGALVIESPDGKLRAFFFAFQSQTFDTDDKTGNPKTSVDEHSGGGVPAKKASFKKSKVKNVAAERPLARKPT